MRSRATAGVVLAAGLALASPAGAVPVHTTQGGCAVANVEAQGGAEATCRFDATTSLGYSGQTDTGYAIFHYEKQAVLDARGCPRTAAGGGLLTRLAKVYDVDSRSSGPFVATMSFAPGVTYTAVIRGTGAMSAGNVDAAGVGSEPATDTPLDRTAGLDPARCAGDVVGRVGTVANGLRFVDYQQLDGRLAQLTFQTSAIVGDTRVRVLTPSDFDTSGKTRYPVLFLLHGALNNQAAWTDLGDAERITAGYPLIVVMPDSGTTDGYVDWYNGGAFGPPKWETYHLTQLLPWIDAHYPTSGSRSGRALAGLSMGGYGAMEYAARRPDLFVAASAFSGAVDTSNAVLRAVGEPSAASGHSGYGEWQTNEGYVRGHNPTDLAPNLKGLELELHTGNGQPGGPDPNGAPADPVEMDVHEQSVAMHDRLTQLGLPHVWDDYGAGTHSWFYWNRELRELLPGLMRVFARPPAPPSRVDYRSIDPSYAAYGWNVSIARPAREFSELRGAERDGFELLGSGSGTVTTPPLYRPGSRQRATIRAAAGTAVQIVRADSGGRVRLAVPLGPGNADDQYSPQAKAKDAAGGRGTAVYRTRVELRPARKP